MADPVTIATAVGWGIKILGWVVSPILSKLVSKGLEYLDDVSGSSAGKLKSLQRKVLDLNQMLGKAQQVPPGGQKTKLEGWVKELKSAFYDAQDILDAVDYHRLQWEATSRRQSVHTTKKKATAKKDFKFPPGLKDKLRETIAKIEKLIDEGQTLLSLLGLTTSGDNIQSSPEQTTGSGSLSKTTSEPPKVFGRAGDTEEIISMLHDTAADHSVIGIHGISGSGKTTLAQNVCEREKNSEDRYFELIMWIHVTKNFSVHTVYHEMLEIASAGKEKDRFSNLDMLQNELKKNLKGKRFLLVLDDVWCPGSVHEKNDLEKLLSPLKEADKGSRVLVTSRTADVAKLLGARNPMPISDMDEGEFFKMFMHYALDNWTVSDQDKLKFESIGKKISLLLRKSPLAARTVAGQLKIRTHRAEDIDFWINTLNRNDLLNDTMGALWWSYHQLEEHVQQCFAYCSMFPRRHKLKQDEIVQMWMAQGFVDTSKNSDMEVAARECFEVLLSTSFIQLKPEQDYYTVHDLLHDLAGIVAGSDCFRIEKDMVDHQIPQDVRHLFIDSGNLGDLIKQIEKLDTLRTLVMSSPANRITAAEFKRMLKYLKKLRFVDVRLQRFGADVIGECITGELKHLRYLGIDGLSSDARIDLPLSFTKLYHLQKLNVPLVGGLRCLDTDSNNHIADLVNLRDIRGSFTFSVSIPDIGRMRWLQTMGAFIVKKEKGYEITQLEKLDNIRGKLSIKGLVHIQSKEDARQANLSNKLHVSLLELDWEDEDTKWKKRKTAAGHHQQVVTPEPEEILEALHPPALLVQLRVLNYDGSTFPSWLSGEDGKLEHLEFLLFEECHGSGSQLKFSKPLSKLRRLRIEYCSWNALPDNIEQQLASLEELRINFCDNIQSLPGLPSSLKILEIMDCKKFKTLPKLPPYLKKLRCNRALLDSYPDRQAIDRIQIEIWT